MPADHWVRCPGCKGKGYSSQNTTDAKGRTITTRKTCGTCNGLKWIGG